MIDAKLLPSKANPQILSETPKSADEVEKVSINGYAFKTYTEDGNLKRTTFTYVSTDTDQGKTLEEQNKAAEADGTTTYTKNLPQTNESKSHLGLIGGLIALAAIIGGFFGFKKFKKN